MLEEMRITGLGVIDEAVIELGPGLNVLSGETGAGKTMVVSGLGLLLGARADAALVRAGCKRAVVDGRLRVDPSAPAPAALRDLDVDFDDDGTLLVSRTVTADGRSRAYIGGRAVPVGVLAEFMSELVAVHGQAEQLRLRQPASHRVLLDQYAGDSVARPLAAYQTAYHRHRDVLRELQDITTRTQERAREADGLRFGLDEVAAATPQAGEDVALAVEVERLSHVDALQTAATAARSCLSADVDGADERDAQTLLATARSTLDAAAGHDDVIATLAGRLHEVEVLLADVGGELAAYLSALDANPARLEAALDRQATLRGLVRKYAEPGAGIDGVLAWAHDAAARLTTLDDDDERVEILNAERDRLAAELAELATRLTAARRKAAKQLAQAVTTELGQLALPGARLAVEISTTTAGPAGADEVELQLATHAEAPLRPVQKTASGGELSRVMLALEVALAGRDPVPTFVFDEVDAGVGGRAAAEVGRRLAQLGSTAQVVVVTHLPQVAAFADRHLRVEKSAVARGTVSSDVVSLDTADRVLEISRMLAGRADSEHARGHAEELIAAATANRG